MLTQLTLGIALSDDTTFDNFYVGANQQVVKSLHALIQGGNEPVIYLWGAADGVGISHLLQACCHRACQRDMSAIFLPLSEALLTPAVFQDLEAIDLVCVDDVDAVLGQQAWEEGLLHLYNRVRDGGSRLVIAARQIPALSVCCLPDLKSRFSWGLNLRVDGLSDEDKLGALRMRFASRGLIASDQAIQFLLRHYGDSMKQLVVTLDTLDNASLIEKRKLTVPFIKKVMASNPISPTNGLAS